MRKVFIIFLSMMLSVSVIGQQKIQLRSVNKAECVKSDMNGLKASFSFNGIDATEMNNERGTFSMISMPNTVSGGNVGAPQIPVVNELIAVPFGATPNIRVTNYSVTDYNLEELGIHKLSPRQPDFMKNETPEFVYNEADYQTRGMRSEPMARVSVNGTMRGVQVGQITVEPVSYDPVNNTLRVFNDIEVEVSFDGADARATEDMLVKTYSPYFDVLYKQLFNGRAVRDVYDEHPDLWKSPVRMLVIANRMFENCIQDWVAWKTMKGIYVDVYYTDNIGTSADAIKSFIQTKYAENAPTFLMIMGDEDQVPPSITSASMTSEVSDLYYSSVDGDQFVEMFHSRFSAETTAQMTAMLNKSLEYERYTMPDPSYLNNVLLIAGHDTSGWGVTVGRPTIWYATNYYYNAEHGFNNVYSYTTDDYTNCYAPLNSGVGFANYTAHGAKTAWADPEFSVDDVANMTNEHKYFFAIGNCCITGDWGYSTPCFGEALTRAENKGAFAYIGSCPNTVWLNDYYFGVGPTSRADGTMPTYEETGTGIYDAIWMDDVYNTVNSILYVGNLAGNAAQALGYDMHREPLYYWQAYHVLGDGSVMPYRVQPTANNVSHMAILPIGMSTYEVSAVPGSYVAISKDGVLHGTGLIGETGTAQVEITPVTSGGDVTICVTAPNRIPYIQTVPAAALEGAYLAVDGYTPTVAHVGDNTNLSITFKNVGTSATTGTTNITLTTDDSNVTLNHNTGSFGALAADATATVSGFSFSINPGVADGTNVTIHYTAVNGEDTYEGNIVIKANEAVLEYKNMSWNGGFTPGETLTLTAKFKNTGHYQATNAVATISTSSNYLTLTNQTINVGNIAVDQEVSCQFTVTIAANCPETEVIPVTFTMTADGNLSTQGNETLKNSCIVTFNLHDSYSGNDGWNGATLIVSFDDGTPSQNLTIENGFNSATYPLEIGNGTHVTLTWSSGSYDGECSFTVSYEGDLLIYSQSTRPTAGVLYEFDCNCAAASQTYMVTVASENTEYGTVSGGGEFNFGQTCTVTATPVDGYMFAGWTQDGEVVSGNATYTFIVTSDMNLVANFAEGTMIGDGGDATSNYLPSYNYYDYSLSQQIYTAAELGSAGLITSIAFYNGGAEKTRNYDFYMKNTAKSTFSGSTDWETVSEADKVFSGNVTMTADAWTYINLDTPFIYDGSSNVVLVADDNTGGFSSSPHMACRVFDATGQALYKYQDNTDFDPFASSSYSGTVLNVKNQLLITKEPFSDCMMPVNLTATEVGPDFVRLSWEELGASEEWVVVYGGYFTTATTNEDFLLEGLEPETDYTILVRPICDENQFSNPIHITTLVACPNPQNMELSDITNATATLTWGDYNDSYLVQLGIPAFLIAANFDNAIPTDWTNDATYPWTIVDGHAQSGNAGQSTSTSSISVTVTYPADGTISFDFWSRGEGQDSNDWDNSRFYIDNEQMFRYAAHNDWESYSTTVTAGTHTFKWEYKKDSSVNPDGDCFIIDNVEMKSGETNWNQPIAVEDATYTFTGLDPVTTYCVRVQGICDDTETEWSEIMTFVTTAIKHFVNEGNWNEDANWEPAGVPAVGADVVIDAAAIIPADYLANVGHVTLGTNGSITIEDGGQLRHTNASTDGVTVTLEKIIRGYDDVNVKSGYYFIAPAPFSQTISPNSVENLKSNDYDFYSFYAAASDGLEWRNLHDSNTSLKSAHGYLYANSETVTLKSTGPANSINGGGSLSIQYNPDAGYSLNGWELAGNPYVCNGYVYITDVNNEIVETDFYKMNDDGDGYDLISSTDALKPFEGVFVQINGEQGQYSISFSPDPIESNDGKLNMNLSRNGAIIDMAHVRFGKGQNLGKMSFNESNSKVYIPVEGKDYATVFSTPVGELPVCFKAEKNGRYSLSFSNEKVSFSYLHLIDNLTGADTDLLVNPSYSFEARTTDYASRFKLVFVCGSSTSSDTFAFFSNGSWVINNEGNATLQVVDVTGRILKSESINGCANVNVNAAPGVYMFRLINGENVKTQKAVVR